MSEYNADTEIVDYIFVDPIHRAFETITGKRSIHAPSSLKYYNECNDVVGAGVEISFQAVATRI